MTARTLPALLALPFVLGSLEDPRAMDPAPDQRHLTLLRSAPAADTVLAESPEEVRLWFSETPRENTVTIRVVDPSGGLVHATDPAADPDDDRIYVTRLHHPIPPGAYSIRWRAMSPDGHVVNGEFGFTLTSG